MYVQVCMYAERYVALRFVFTHKNNICADFAEIKNFAYRNRAYNYTHTYIQTYTCLYL